MQDLKLCLCKLLSPMENSGAFLKVMQHKDYLGIDALD